MVKEGKVDMTGPRPKWPSVRPPYIGFVEEDVNESRTSWCEYYILKIARTYWNDGFQPDTILWFLNQQNGRFNPVFYVKQILA